MDLDKLIEYLYTTGQLDENFGLKKEDEEEIDEELEEEKPKTR